MAPTSNRPLRCAVITVGPHLKRWEIYVLATLARAQLAEPAAIWTVEGAPDHTALERLCRRHGERWAAALAPMVAPDQTSGLPVISLDALGAVGELDCVLDFRGDGVQDPLPAGVASLPRWILRIGNARSQTLGAAILAAYCSKASAVDVALLRSERGIADRVLFAGRLPKRATLVETLDAVLLNVADWYEIGCRKLRAGQDLPIAEPASPQPLPGPVCYGAAWLRGRLRSLRSRYTIEIWNIGIAPRPALEVLARGGPITGVTWLPSPPTLTFRADPFGWIDSAGRTSIAHERFDYRAGKGTLEVARLHGAAAAASFEPLADLPVHASYPYLMPVPGLLLCLPEVNESGRTILFKIETEPMRLTYVATLLDDVPLCDGTVFRFGEHHWLFGTRIDRDSQLRLYAWCAKAVDGPWTPHPLNPIKCDITSARPAGVPFWAGGSLIRPAQDCSRSYGGAIALNRIVELTTTTFREETVARIEPDARGPYPHGIHTLSFVGDSLLVDGKRFEFRWNAAALNRRLPMCGHERRLKFRAKAGPSGPARP